MSDLLSRLENELADITRQQNDLMARKQVIRYAVTQLRMGRSPVTVQALLDESKERVRRNVVYAEDQS